MPFQAVIFDLDGTLLDTLEDIGNAVNRVLSLRGYPTHSIDAYRHFVGDGSAVLVRRALPEDVTDEAVMMACYEAFLSEYGQNWQVNTTPYPGIPEMLDALAARGVRMAVLSNKPHSFTLQCVSRFLRPRYFDMVIGQRDAFPKKPHPAGALKVAEHMGISPLHVAFIGDSAIDMQTALAADMFPVGVLWGFRSGRELTESGGRMLVRTPSEILSLFE